MRKWWAVLLNLGVPGAGLILLQREWLGLVIALLFGVLAQVAMWGLWLIPASLPTIIVWSATGGAILVWIGAQVLLIGRWRLAFAAGVEDELEILLARSEAAIQAGDLTSAEEILLVARALNDEHVGVNMTWAALMARMGRFRHARAAWHRVLQLRPAPDVHRQAREALAAMPE